MKCWISYKIFLLIKAISVVVTEDVETTADAVDDVTLEAEETGRIAAGFVLTNKVADCAPIFFTSAGDQSGADFICIGCPKACVLTKTENGFAGAACGRKDPVFSKA